MRIWGHVCLSAIPRSRRTAFDIDPGAVGWASQLDGGQAATAENQTRAMPVMELSAARPPDLLRYEGLIGPSRSFSLFGKHGEDPFAGEQGIKSIINAVFFLTGWNCLLGCSSILNVAQAVRHRHQRRSHLRVEVSPWSIKQEQNQGTAERRVCPR